MMNQAEDKTFDTLIAALDLWVKGPTTDEEHKLFSEYWKPVKKAVTL